MTRNDECGVMFSEDQRFRQKWLWVLLLLTVVMMVVLFAYGFVLQLIIGQPWGSRPLTNAALITVGLISIIVSSGLSYLFYTLRLITEVRQDALYIRFYPLTRKRIAYEDIVSCEVREYRPIREYGGWGIRYGKTGMAYNVSGTRGVQLEMSSGKSLLIGSQRAEELAQAIRKNIERG
jgi:hypothetical protein